MKSVFKHKKQQGQPLLAPLSSGKRLSRVSHRIRNIHIAAIPIGLTIIGSVALVAVLAMMAMKPANVAVEPNQQVANIATDRHQAPAPPAPNLPEAEKPAETAADLFKPALSSGETVSIQSNQSAQDTFKPLLGPSDDPQDTAETQAYQREVAPNTDGAKQASEAIVIPATAPIPAPAPSSASQATPRPSSQPAAPVASNTTVGMRKGVTNSAVNLRASANRGATVIGTIPGQAQIDVQGDCDWCSVSYQGKSGYIYRSFIRYTD